jgi:hypothetical protein
LLLGHVLFLGLKLFKTLDELPEFVGGYTIGIVWGVHLGLVKQGVALS